MEPDEVRTPRLERKSFLSRQNENMETITFIHHSVKDLIESDPDSNLDDGKPSNTSPDGTSGSSPAIPPTISPRRKRSRDDFDKALLKDFEDDQGMLRPLRFRRGRYILLSSEQHNPKCTYEGLQSIRQIPCSCCSKNFKDNRELIKHRSSKHRSPGRPSEASMANHYAEIRGNVKQRYMPSLHGLRHREVPGTVNDIPVKAVPDYGSSIDAVSDGFAREHGMEVKAANKISIKLPGGRIAESVGVVIGHFKFQRESQTYTRYFRVLKKCTFDMVLGRDFLEQTKTLTDFCHRIVKRFRPCVQNGGRFFLLDESPKDRIRCAVNGSNASAFPDTGSDLMLVSGEFARRNNLNVRREEEYRQQVQLADGSFIRTDGMVLDAELEFDAPPMSSPREFDLDQYLEYDRGLTDLLKESDREVRVAKYKSVFICDLHVVDDLPCDIILSSDFIFDHQVFSRFKHLFFTEPPPDPPDPHPSRCIPDPGSSDKTFLGDYLLYIRSTKKERQWFRWGWRRPPTPPPPLPSDSNDNNAVPLQRRQTWEELWEAEEARRNRMQLRIASLSELLRTEEQRAEAQRREDWDRNHPRPPPPMRLVLPPTGAGIGLGMGISGVRRVGEPPGGVHSA